MNRLKITTFAMAFLLAGIFITPNANAQSTFLRRTHVTFSGPVEIPGKVLPAGSYVFQLMPGNETNLVIIRDKNENAIATLMTIPDYRLTPTGETVITYKEQAANTPQAIRAWFYPGENYGHEFAYPRKMAVQLASANHESVPAIPDQTTDANVSSASVTTVTATDTQTQVTQTSPEPVNQNLSSSNYASPANNNSTANNSNNLVAQNNTLPKTASPTFLIALVGIFSLGIAGFLSILGRRLRVREGQSSL